MANRIHKYNGSDIEVSFDPRRCIHSAECVRRLPQVFDTARTPWVLPDAVNAESIADVVKRCPTGALHYRRTNDESPEVAPSENTVTLAKNGPLFSSGDIEMLDANGDVVLRDTRIALCRCGASQNKPFCDNAHRKSGFKDSGAIGFEPPAEDEQSPHSTLRVQPAPNGPLLVDGKVTIVDSHATVRTTAHSPAFCRCGSSGAKPFCDGSHNRVNFKAE